MIKNTKYVSIDLSKLNILEQFIRGSVLGDGSLHKIAGHSKNSRLTFGHGEKQLEYAKWKSKFLENFGLNAASSTYIAKSDRYKNGQCITHTTRSRAHPIFTKFRNLYYPTGKKLVADDVYNIDSFGLAVWYMDDGHLWKRKYRTPVYVFNTTGFEKDDVYVLIKVLRTVFGIEGTYLSTDNCIRIRVESMPLMYKILRPHIIDLFDYKLNWVLNKSGELREQPEMVNPEPSIV